MIDQSIGEHYHYLKGIPVVPDPMLPEFIPVLELSQNITVTPEFRAQEDAWLLKIFGKKRTMYEVKINGRHWYIAHPNTIKCLEILRGSDK